MGQGGDPRGDAPIRFGTSGWRGVLGEDFTVARLRRVLGAVGRWLAREGAGAEVIVAHDTRFLGERLASLAVSVLHAHGQRPVLAQGAVPTPVVARAIRRRRARLGVVFTASHNPPEYQGLKLLDASGGSLGRDQTDHIEALLAAPGADPLPPARRARTLDVTTPYLEDLLAVIERGPIARARLQVCYDAMHGAGAPVLSRALERLGARVTLLHGEPDPRFGGASPDPAPERLRELSRRRARAGGDCASGSRPMATPIASRPSMPAGACCRRPLRSRCSSIIWRAAGGSGAASRSRSRRARSSSGSPRRIGLAVTRHPIGFRCLSQALMSGAADAAADESGGFALGSFGADKDGILSGCLLAELVADEPRAAARPAPRARASPWALRLRPRRAACAAPCARGARAPARGAAGACRRPARARGDRAATACAWSSTTAS